ncbi:MAG: lysophospholipid acyltransferase family protein [Chloroflexota bacterium]
MGIRTRLLGGGDASIARARRPEALRAAMTEPPKEGIDWLGRVPGPRAPRLYRLLLALGDGFLFRVCGLRVAVHGRETLPPGGGYVLAVGLHRSWIDPLLVIRALPREPRPWFLGSGPTAFDRPWKERLLRRTGGILPVWRGGSDLDIHVRTARATVGSGAVLALFIEGAIGEPPDRLARVRDGAALLALRTDAPVVWGAVCGAEQLYRGKRMVVRLGPPASVAELLGETGDAWRPEPGSRDELRVARRLTRAIAAHIDAAVAADFPGTVDAADRARRWTWLTRLMR